MDARRLVVNVDAAVWRDGSYLLIERATSEDHAAGLLGLPGGKVEWQPGEMDVFKETVVRELDEEVGIDVANVQYVTSSLFEADEGTPCLNVVTTADHAGGTATVRAPDEVVAVHWFSMDEIRDRDDVPAFTERYLERVERARASRDA